MAGSTSLWGRAMMWAATGDAEVKKRLDYAVAELKRCQDALGNGYIGGIPDGATVRVEEGDGGLVLRLS